jgi:hypothetical protein
MLKKLVEFIKNNHPDADLNEYLDAKYIHLTSEQLKKIAEAIQTGELASKPASNCSAKHFIFHFGSTLILLKREKDNSDTLYQAELSWETDFLSVRSVRDKAKGFYFVNFSLNDNYQAQLQSTTKTIKGQVDNSEKNQVIVDKVLPVLKGFMLAISN